MTPDNKYYQYLYMMAKNPRLKDNPLNDGNRQWWAEECKRIEAIRTTTKVITTNH